MDPMSFDIYLKRGGRSPSAKSRAIRLTEEFEVYLTEHCGGVGLAQATPEHLQSFVDHLEAAPNSSAKSHLWALHYFYDSTGNDLMKQAATELRRQRINSKAFQLRQFSGVSQVFAEALAAIGIVNVDQMLEAGRTHEQRREVADKTHVPIDVIEEFVKLSDLARLRGVRGIRARLYYDAGVETLEQMAQWDPERLRQMLIEFVERTGFEGIPPLSKEAANAVATAKRLSKVVEW